MPTADEGLGWAKCGQWRRVIGGEHQMPAIRVVLCDQLALGLRMRAPEHEDHGAAFLGAGCNQTIRQLLPAALGMRGRLAVLNRQAGIEQQHALACPASQRAMRGRCEV